MLLKAIKSLDTTFTVVQECLLPNFLVDRGKCMPTVKSLYSPAPEYFSPVGCHKMAFCSQIKEQKILSCLPLASEMYRHSMALNSSCRRRNKISYLKKFKFVFLLATIEHEGYRMVFASICEHSSTASFFASTSSDQICLASSEHFRNYNWRTARTANSS